MDFYFWCSYFRVFMVICWLHSCWVSSMLSNLTADFFAFHLIENPLMLIAWLDGAEVSAFGWGSRGPRFQSHPRLTFQSCSRYQLNQLGSKVASKSTFKKSNTCGVSNTRLFFTYESSSIHYICECPRDLLKSKLKSSLLKYLKRKKLTKFCLFVSPAQKKWKGPKKFYLLGSSIKSQYTYMVPSPHINRKLFNGFVQISSWVWTWLGGPDPPIPSHGDATVGLVQNNWMMCLLQY